MADSRRIYGWLAAGAALAVALVLVLLVLREDEPLEGPPVGEVVTRSSDVRLPDKPVISAPETVRPPPPPPKPAAAHVGSVSGRLLNPERQALPASRIELLQGDNAGLPGLVELAALGLRGVADADGRFLVNDVPAMSDLMLRVDGDAVPTTELGPFGVRAGQLTDLGELVIAPGLAITGIVMDAQGHAVPGARIGLLQGRSGDAGQVHEPDSIPEPSRLVLSNEDGRFRIEHAAHETFMLAVSAKGFAHALVPGGPLPGERHTQMDIRVQLQPAGTLRGRVLADADDRPLAGARVFAEPMDPGSGRAHALTGADGRFVLEDIVPGNYSVSASLKGYSRTEERTFDETPDAEVVLRLQAQGSLAGTIVGSDGEPVRAFDLQPHFRKRRLDPPVPRGAFQRVQVADGRFHITDLDEGFWSVDVWSRGYALTSSEPVKVKQGESVGGLTVLLRRGASLHGFVRDTEGQPVSGAVVTLHGNREPEVDFLRSNKPLPGGGLGTRTADDGSFTLEDLAARTYQVQVDHPDHAVLRRNDVKLAPEQELREQLFVLTRAATVTGTAVGVGGETLAGVTVSLTQVDGFSRQTTSDGRGQFTFARVLEGNYQLVCYGRQLSFAAMIASAQNPPEAFRVAAGAIVQRNAVSLE